MGDDSEDSQASVQEDNGWLGLEEAYWKKLLVVSFSDIFYSKKHALSEFNQL